MSDSKYYEGQEVVIRDVNDRRRPEEGPLTATITRVGRKLVYVTLYGREKAYRIESGVANDNYGHSSLQTWDEYHAEKRRAEVVQALQEAGFIAKNYSFPHSTEVLERVLKAATGEP